MTCVIDYKTQPVMFRCTVCGGTAPFPLPMTVQQMRNLTDQFTKDHKPCEMKPRG